MLLLPSIVKSEFSSIGPVRNLLSGGRVVECLCPKNWLVAPREGSTGGELLAKKPRNAEMDPEIEIVSDTNTAARPLSSAHVERRPGLKLVLQPPGNHPAKRHLQDFLLDKVSG